MWYVFLFLLILILMLVLLSNVRVNVQFQRIHSDDRLDVYIKALYGLVKLHYEVPLFKLNVKDQSLVFKGDMVTARSNKLLQSKKKRITPSLMMKRLKNFRKKLHEIYGFVDWMKQTLKYVRCDKMEWYSKIGTVSNVR